MNKLTLTAFFLAGLWLLQNIGLLGAIIGKVADDYTEERWGTHAIEPDGTKRVPNGTMDVIIPPPVPQQAYSVPAGQRVPRTIYVPVPVRPAQPQASPSPCDGVRHSTGCGHGGFQPVPVGPPDGFQPVEVVPLEP